MLIQSFEIAASFALFRDPTVTTCPTSYTIPPKSAIIGLISSFIGFPRSPKEDYSEDYCDLLSKTKVGVELLFNPAKTTMFINHIGLKVGRKPMKMEFLIEPKYRIYLSTNDARYAEKIGNALTDNAFVYTPYLGHSYCLARVHDYKFCEGKETREKSFRTKTVAVEKKGELNKPALSVLRVGATRLIIERHLFHEIVDGRLKKSVLKHYAPVNGEIKIELQDESRMTIVNAEGENICLY
ncbi:MAG: CRISPR-associated protein Cas5 [Candidatus Micrarchaeota archaeon]|nr:CRISPR-associated protein Cas5 [Candidatus Micrarchaeota archaeon]